MSHPIQYYAPWFRFLATRMDVDVMYAHRQDARGQAAAGFGVEFDWDVPLLDGYRYRWLTNVARRPGLQSFGGCDTPEVYEFVRTGGYDASVVFGWNRKSAIQAVLASRRAGVPVLMRGDSHLFTPRSPLKRALKYLPYRLLLSRLDGHLYVGLRNREYLEHYGVPDDRLFFAPHFVDNERFAARAAEARRTGASAELRRALGIPPDAFVFLYVGKFIPLKRVEDFIAASVRLVGSDAGADTYALVVGDGPLRPALERLGAQRADRIKFAGFRNQRELPAVYAASDAVVLTSQWETWGLVVSEATACGIPAVVSDAVGCGPDLIEPAVTGFSYPVGNIDGLTEALIRMKALCRTRRREISEALAANARRYSIQAATEGLERALRAVTSRRSSTGESR